MNVTGNIIKEADAASLWTRLKEVASPGDSLILVNNLLMEREVRHKWQRDQKGFAPDIHTLASWLQELAIHSLDASQAPSVILSPEDRSLWLEQWLSTHPRKEFRRFAGIKSVTAISNIIGELHREHQHPGALLNHLKQSGRWKKSSGRHAGPEEPSAHGESPDRGESPAHGESPVQHASETSSGTLIAELLASYEEKRSEMNAMDQEQLLGKVRAFRNDLIRHEKLVFFLIDEWDPVQQYALQCIDKSDYGKKPQMIHVQFADGESDASGGEVFLDTFHHPREELEQAARCILTGMAQHESGHDKKGDTRKEHEQTARAPHGSRFEDYVVLTGDLSLYEDLIPTLSERFRIPFYTSRGPSLISHPFVRRLLTYLKLDHHDFQVDDVSRVFADNRMILPQLSNNEEHIAPNIRHFAQFCRAYNFRTLHEVAEGMDRVFEGLLNHIAYEEDQEKEEQRRKGLRRDRGYYAEVVGHLQKLRGYYHAPEEQSIKAWVQWARMLLDLQNDLMSREANEARQLLEIILEKLSASQDRLGLYRTISRHQFFKLLELRLKETREKPEEKPGGVLLTEIRHLPDLHDKTVFVLGLHEEGFPKPDRPDFLQFRYQKALEQLTGRHGSESYDLARFQLVRLLSSRRPRYLSRPLYVEQKQVMPSPLWLDMEDSGHHSGSRFESPDDATPVPDKLITNRDMGMWAVQNHSTAFDHSGGDEPAEQAKPAEQAEQNEQTKPADTWPQRLAEDRQTLVKRYRIAAKVQKQRQNPEAMGPYDGVIDPGLISGWLHQQEMTHQMNTSISRLDTFANSPLEYFFKYVLRLQPLHEFQDDAESNIKGTLLHHILQEFYSETDQEGPTVWPADDPEAARLRMDRIRKRLLDDYHHQLGNPDSPFPELLKSNMERVTRWFLQMEQESPPKLDEALGDLRPAVFYPGFGMSMEHRWQFEKKVDEFQVRFRGLIDRVDITPDGSNALIYDYKSGSSGVQSYKGRILRGLSFQLPVYGMYIRERGIPHHLSGYYKLPISGKRKDMERIYTMGSAEMVQDDQLYTRAGKRNSRSLHYKEPDKLDAFLNAIRELRIAWIMRAIRAGRFHLPLTPESKWSDFRFISRYDSQVQMQRKNVEKLSRKDKGMAWELDRYYLDETFWEDTNDE